MPKPNYRFEKKQREMRKNEKKEQKRAKKLARVTDDAPAAPKPEPTS